MKNNITTILFGAALLIAAFFIVKNIKGGDQKVEIKCPTCPVCPADQSAEVVRLQSRIQSLEAERDDLKQELGKVYAQNLKKQRKSTVPATPVDDPEAGKVFKEQLELCQSELDDLEGANGRLMADNQNLSSKYREAESAGRVLQVENDKLKSELKLAENAVNELTSQPLITSEPTADPPKLKFYRKNQINLGAGYLENPFYSVGYQRNIAPWFGVGVNTIYSPETKSAGGMAKISVIF